MIRIGWISATELLDLLDSTLLLPLDLPLRSTFFNHLEALGDDGAERVAKDQINDVITPLLKSSKVSFTALAHGCKDACESLKIFVEIFIKCCCKLLY